MFFSVGNKAELLSLQYPEMREHLIQGLEEKLINHMGIQWFSEAENWMRIKKEKVTRTAYLATLKRLNKVFEEKEKWIKKCGEPFAFLERGLNSNEGVL
jgi:hypothetical protein